MLLLLLAQIIAALTDTRACLTATDAATFTLTPTDGLLATLTATDAATFTLTVTDKDACAE